MDRFEAYRSVHSWELANEQDPNSLAGFRLAAALATVAPADGSSSQPDVCVLGQKDLQAGRAYLGIDNAQHAWRTVVDVSVISPIAGTVSIPMQTANAHYAVAWFGTHTGQRSSSQTIVADSAGVVVLSISNLASDTTAKITRML